MDIETRTIARVTRRLIPFLILCYFVAYLDRVNVGFAGLQMSKQLGLSATMFGIGSGIFFVAYFFFEVPSNLFLERFGARRWIARIMLTWGLISGAMTFIPAIARVTGIAPQYVFYTLRVLLGFAEAGFFPGIIFFLTLWFPSQYRARMVGYFMTSNPLGTVIGGPVSGLLLNLDGLSGLAGWQWMFLIEAVPALLLSVAVLTYLTDTPAQAKWLAPEQRDWLVERQAREQRQREAAQHFSLWQALSDPRVLATALIYFGATGTNYGLSFFLPQIVKDFGLSNVQTGFVTALPYAVGLVGMVLWSRHSDRTGERRGHIAISLAVAAGGIAASTAFGSPVMRMACLSIAGFGIFSCLPVIWTLPTAYLSGAAAAAGIAAVNSLGNLAGFAGPFAMGTLRDATGNFNAGLLVIAGIGLVSVITVLLIRHDAKLERAPESAPAG